MFIVGDLSRILMISCLVSILGLSIMVIKNRLREYMFNDLSRILMISHPDLVTHILVSRFHTLCENMFNVSYHVNDLTLGNGIAHPWTLAIIRIHQVQIRIRECVFNDLSESRILMISLSGLVTPGPRILVPYLHSFQVCEHIFNDLSRLVLMILRLESGRTHQVQIRLGIREYVFNDLLRMLMISHSAPGPRRTLKPYLHTFCE